MKHRAFATQQTKHVTHRLLAVTAILTLLLAIPQSSRAQSARWNTGNRVPNLANPLNNRGNVGRPQQQMQAPHTTYLNVAGIGRVPISPRVGISPGHSAFSPSSQTLYYSAGRYSANRYGRLTEGVSRGGLGTRNYWQSFQGSRPSVIVAPTWGFSPHGYSYFNPYSSYAGYHSSSLSVFTTPIVTPYNAHTVPIITSPCWYSGYGCANFFATPFCFSPVGAACGYLPGYSMIGVSIGSGYSPPVYGSSGYFPSSAVTSSSVIAESIEPITLSEPDPVIPDLDGHQAFTGEFAPVDVQDKKSSLPDKIHSLRYQASGDDAFRNHDFASAEVFYQTAIQTSPERPASYLRMAFVHLAQGEYAEAASWLKTGLDLPSDRTQSWVSWQQLYGGEGSAIARDHSELLWQWVADRPLSTDRLLVAAAFQKLRGYHGTGDEILQLLKQQGEAQRVNSLLAMIDDARQQAVGANASLQSSVDAVRTTPGADSGRRTANAAFEMTGNSVSAPSPSNTSGIHLRGSEPSERTVPDPPEPKLDDNPPAESQIRLPAPNASPTSK